MSNNVAPAQRHEIRAGNLRLIQRLYGAQYFSIILLKAVHHPQRWIHL